MSHMVIYLSADGQAGYQQVDDLGAAVAFVERIRNTQGIENSRIYRMEQVNYRFEPYYQVRLESGELLGGPYPTTSSSESTGSWQATGAPVAAGPAATAAPSAAPPASAGAAGAPGTPSAATAPGSGTSTVGGALGDPATRPEPGEGNGAKRGLLR